jgi:hypothetical protein
MGYLQDQAVMTFAGTAARGSAIGTAVSEGMVSYLADSNVVQAYTGSSWDSLAYATAIPTVGLKPIIAPTVNYSGGTATANSLGIISFSAVTSLSLNSVFTSAYNNYKVIVAGLTGSVVTQTFGRWRVSGTDTAANYDNAAFYVKNGATSGVAGVTGATLSSFGFAYHYNSSGYRTTSAILDVYGPQLAQSTTATYQSANYDSSFFSLNGATYHSPSTQFDGLTIFPGSGNITGTIQVFGYNS